MSSLSVLRLLLALCLAFAGRTLAKQMPFRAVETADVHTLSSETFSTFSHPSFPEHGLRIKKTPGFCDPTVNVYTGYLDVSYGSKHLFFWFFESRNDPSTDDVVMWINGGPGGSSALGAFMELGPCSIDINPGKNSNGTRWNPYGWNDKANLFFLDQPVGVGFSYADYGQRVTNTPDAAKDVYAFVSMFFDVFSQFKGRPFHMSGESYGGRYLPVFASEIVDGNERAKAEGRTPINLQSLLIGNGFTHPEKMIPTYYDMQCTSASGYPPLQSISTCVRMKNALPRCKVMLQEGCLDRMDSIDCSSALDFCDSLLMQPFVPLGFSPYDVRKVCEGEDVTCYVETAAISKWLDLNSTRTLLGVDETAPRYEAVSLKVNSDFALAGDEMQHSETYVAQLLERGIRVLIYVGTTDFVCNWVGNLHWVDDLDWSGHEAFSKVDLRDWSVDLDPSVSASSNRAAAAAGQTKSSNGLTYLTISDSGHMVPYDKPLEALIMLNRWIAGVPF